MSWLLFDDDDEVLGSPHNGNFLAILELISQFNPFLAEHISGVKKGSVVHPVFHYTRS